MEIQEDCLDHVLHNLYEKLLATGLRNVGSRGATRELLGVALRIQKPRARISRSENRGRPFSALGELLWYLSGSDTLEFIDPYVKHYRKEAVEGKIQGAYGPRLVAMRESVNQIENVVRLLSAKPASRRAVIQLFNAEDIATDHREIPCTTTLQFHIRGGLLHMSVTMRSNDAYWGLPHDVFCFTMLQEIMARRLDCDLGEYYHYAGSMHIYEDHINATSEYEKEGFQRISEMPVMPIGDPIPMVTRLLKIEQRLRAGEQLRAGVEILDPYWADIVRLLQVFWAKKWETDAKAYDSRLIELRDEMTSDVYRPYIEGRRKIADCWNSQQGHPDSLLERG